MREYMPDFRLSNEVAERFANARDLMSHRTGLPRHDSLWYGRTFTRQELFQRLRYLDFNYTFRQRWQYNNLMVTTAGVLAERITGRSWEDLVRSRLFVPLGMTRSSFTLAEMQKSDEYALGYGLVADKPRAVAYRDLESTGPSGSINSSAEELISFVQMFIDKGTFRDKQVLSNATVTEMQYPQINKNRGTPINRISDQDEGSDGLGPSAYGLGLSVTTYRGRKFISHGGGIDGFVSNMAWLPDEKIGVVVLTNSGGFNPVGVLLERNVLDRLLNIDQIDWPGRTRKYWARILTQFSGPPEPCKVTTPVPRPLTDFTGTFEHPGYGRFAISIEDSKLVARFEKVDEPMVLEQDCGLMFRPKLAEITTLGSWRNRRVSFHTDALGKVNRLTIPLESDLPEIVFVRN